MIAWRFFFQEVTEAKKEVTEEGFEPSPPKRLVPETSALDRSAIQPMPEIATRESKKR